MNKSRKNKVKKIIDRLQTSVDEIEELLSAESQRLEEMEPRARLLQNREETIERDTACLDIARININEAIEDLSKTLEDL